MIRLLGVIFLMLLVVGALGVYLGWFTVTQTGDARTPQIGVSVDRQKMEADSDRAKRKLGELGVKISR